MKDLLKQVINSEGREILANIELLAQKLICSDDNNLKRQQLLLLLTELRQNDVDILCGTDSIQKSNIIRRCLRNTGMSARICFNCFSDLLYALGCDEYLENIDWFCGTPVDVDNEKVIRIMDYHSVQEVLDHAKTSTDKEEAMMIYRTLADAGVPQAKTTLALECLASNDLEEKDKKKALTYLSEAANEGYEPACRYLGDLAMKTADFEKASHWYGLTIGTGLNEDTKQSIKFLNKVRRTNVQTILLSVLALLVSLVSMILIIIVSNSSTAAIVVASVFELVSAFFVGFIVIYNLMYPHKNIVFILLLQNLFWVFAMIILM